LPSGETFENQAEITFSHLRLQLAIEFTRRDCYLQSAGNTTNRIPFFYKKVKGTNRVRGVDNFLLHSCLTTVQLSFSKCRSFQQIYAMPDVLRPKLLLDTNHTRPSKNKGTLNISEKRSVVLFDLLGSGLQAKF